MDYFSILPPDLLRLTILNLPQNDILDLYEENQGGRTYPY
jgi:hypothetical protein